MVFAVVALSGLGAATCGSAAAQERRTPPHDPRTRVDASVGELRELDRGGTVAVVVAVDVEHRWLPTFSSYVRPAVWLLGFYGPTYHVGAGVRLSWPPRLGILFASVGFSAGTHTAYDEESVHRWDFALFLEGSIGVTIPTGTPLFFRLEGEYHRLLNTGGYECPPPVTGTCANVLGVNLWSLDLGVGVRF